jgi:MFS family permease
MAPLPRTARVLVLTAPLFAPTALVGAYVIAYQDALGLAPEQIGALGSAAAGLGFLFLLLGPAVAERWGRLAAVSLFDVAGFVVPFALLAAAQGPREVVAAALLGATSQGAGAGFQALLMAEVREGQRQRVLALEHLLLGLPSAAMPLLAAAMVAAWGLVPAVRAACAVAAAGVGAMVLVRLALLRGPRPPRAPLEGPRLERLAPGWRGLRRAGLGPLLVASGLLGFAGGLGVLAQVRIVRVAGLDAAWLGPFAFAMTAADLGASALAARGRLGSIRLAWAGAGLAGLGCVVFVLAREPLGLLASGAVLGIAGAWAGLGTGAWLHDLVPEALRERAAAGQLATRALGGFAGPAVAGLLFARDPAWPWWAAAAVFGVAGLLLVVSARRVRHDADRAWHFSDDAR